MKEREIGQSINEVISETMISLSVNYAREYERDPRSFISCFLKFPSVRSACAWIVWSYKKTGTFNECKGDFSEWANKQKVGEKWKRVLAEVLKIIHSIIQK